MSEEGGQDEDEDDTDKEEEKLKQHVSSTLFLVNFWDEVGRRDVGESTGGKRDENGDACLDGCGEKVRNESANKACERREDIVPESLALLHST